MAFATTSDPFLGAALWIGIGAIAASLCLLLSIAVMRMQLLRREAHDRTLAARWNPVLAECAEQVPAILPPLADDEVEAFLVLWCRALESLRGHALDELRTLARRLGVELHLAKMLDSGRLDLKLLAVVCFGHLRSRDVIPRLLALLRDAPSMVSSTAARALMRIDPAIAMPHVLEATARREDWALANVVPAFTECDPAQVGPILAGAIGIELYKERRGVRVGGVARLIRLHVAANAPALRAAFVDVLTNAESPSALVAALDALSHPEDVQHARRLLDHMHWPVRAAAARALGRFGTAEDFAALSEALGDSNWWVRYRAARALCALPQANAGELRALAARLTDRFAADTLREALSEQAGS